MPPTWNGWDSASSKNFLSETELSSKYTVNDARDSMPRPVEWRTATIEEIAEKVGMGPFGSSIKVETFVPEGIPIISGQHLHGARLDENPGFHHISPEHAQRLVNSNVFRGDIILTHRGTLGQVALIPDASKFERYIVSQSQFYIRCDRSKVDPEYVTLYLKSPEGQHQLLANSSQVGVPSIAQPVTYLRSIEIPIPPLPEQQTIAHVLGTLNDKIELNRRMNQTLEEMDRAIFQDWFVDFGPTRAKMKGLEPYLPPELWDLFPEQLVDSELGEIPDGWEWKTVKDCFDLTMGQSPPGSTYNDHGDGLPFFQGSTDFGARFPANRRFCSAPARTAQRDDTLISVRAPIGDMNMAWERCCIGRGVAALRHKSGASSFTYHSSQSMKPEIQVYEQTGTVFGAITKKQFESVPFLDPQRQLLGRFEALVQPLDQRIRSNTDVIVSLTAQRDTLLPKLMSGELKPEPLKEIRCSRN